MLAARQHFRLRTPRPAEGSGGTSLEITVLGAVTARADCAALVLAAAMGEPGDLELWTSKLHSWPRSSLGSFSLARMKKSVLQQCRPEVSI